MTLPTVQDDSEDTMSDSETKDAAPEQEEDQDQAKPDEDQAGDADETSDEDQASDKDQSGEDDGEDDGESGDDGEDGGDGGEIVDVAPDPERTGIKVEKPERADALSADELEKIRQERLDPDNRPDNVEVDNTQRDFNPDTGKFEDSDLDEDLGPLDDDAV